MSRTTTKGAVWTMAAAVALMLAPGAAAQEWRATGEACPDRWGGGDRDRACRTLETTMAAPSVLEVDGGRNGGIDVVGHDGDRVEVVARVWGRAWSDDRARQILEGVELDAADGRLRASGPSTDDDEGWGVSWEVRVPRRQDLRLTARNGGLAVEGVDGSIDMDTRNGGIRLVDLAGDVRARTQNGGVRVELDGSSWQGAGLDVETRNGGVELRIPEGYSARLETGTRNGGMELGFPVTVRGRLGRSLETTLGDGGPTVRVVTTNGGVSVRRR